MGFLHGVGGLDKIGSVVKDIRDAVIDYQVCTHTNPQFLPLLTFAPDLVPTR